MITAQTMRRCEVWSAYACEGGTRLAVIADPLSVVARVALDGTASLTVVLPLESAAAPEIVENRVLRVDESDTSFDEWRILDVAEDDAASTVTVTAIPVLHDIGRRAIVGLDDGLGRTQHTIDVVGLTPTQVIDTYVLPALSAHGITWVSKGTITPTAPLTLTMQWDTPLAVLRQLAAETSMELQLRRNGATGYLIDLIAAIGSTATVSDVRARKNLVGLRRARAGASQATRVYPRGAEDDGIHATMARAVWEVQALAGSVVTLKDPAGGDGPIGFDGQLVGRYLRKPDGTLTQITASSRSAQTVTVASATGLVAGDRVQVRRDSAGRDLTYLESPADVAAYGRIVGVLDVSDVPAAHNIAKNPALRAWPGATPTDWTVEGTPTVAKELVQTQIGGQSAKVTATADGQGLATARQPIETSADNPYGSGYVKVYVVSGQVRVQLLAWSAIRGETAFPTGKDLATSSGIGAWLDLGVAGIDLQAIGATHARVRVVAHGGPAVFYVDGGQCTNSASQQPFVEGSGGTQLWQAANERLRTQGAPAQSFDVSLVDLARLDGATWGDDAQVVLGGTVRVTQPRMRLGITTRIVGVERDYLTIGNTRLTLSTNPDDFTGTLARPKRLRAGSTGIAAAPDGRALAGLDEYGRLITGVNDSADIAGSRADVVRGAMGSSPTSLLVNGGGKEGPLGVLPTGWLTSGGGAFATRVTANDAAKYGGRSLKIAHSAAGGSAIYQGVPVVAGRVYRLGGWIKTTAMPAGDYARLDIWCPTTGATVLEKVTDANVPDTGDPDVGLYGNGTARDWTYVQALFSPKVTETIYLYLHLLTAGAQSAWFDGVVLEEVPPQGAQGGRRGWLALTDTNRLATGIEPTADIAGVNAQIAARAGGAMFLDPFETVPSDWRDEGNPGAIALQNTGGQTGGKVLRCTGLTWRTFPRNIPFDPTKLYRIRARVRQVTAPTSGGSGAFVGVQGVAADGVTLVNIDGVASANTQHHVAASNRVLTVAEGWVVVTGWFRGWGAAFRPANDPRDPSPLHANVRYIRPAFILNFDAGNGVAEIDYIALDVFDEDAAARLYAALRTDGALAEGVAQYDGARSKLLARGILAGTGKHGDVITFSAPFQRAPLLIVTNEGGLTQEPRAKWGANGDGTETGAYRTTDPTEVELRATGVTTTQFKISARLVQRGSVVPGATDFPVGNGTNAVSGSVEANAFSGSMPASGDAYVVNFKFTSNLRARVGTSISRTYVVSIEVDLPGTGAWLERGAQSYTHDADDSGVSTIVWDNEKIPFALAGMTTASKVRLKIKSVSTTGTTAAGTSYLLHGYNPTDDGGKRGVTYSISTGDQYATMTPNATGREIRWVAVEV